MRGEFQSIGERLKRFFCGCVSPNRSINDERGWGTYDGDDDCT